MNRRQRRTIESVLALNGGTHWADVEDVLRKALDAEIYEGSGSTVTFVVKGRKLTVDRPHPRRECGRGLVTRVRDFLDEVGYTASDD